jgi:CubicO group peptidase (beta-lactamase class C family)
VGGYPGSFGHRGATPGSNAHFWVFPQSRTVVAALSNDDWGGNLVGDYLRDLIVP